MVDTSCAQQMKILYVDDDTDLIEIYTRFFENSKYSFRTAYNAEEGYEIAQDFCPDLIICDVAMPGMSGIEFCSLIRRDELLKDVVFLLVSGIEVESDDIVDGYSAGADDYLVKPFSRNVIFAKIDAMLRGRSPDIQQNYSEKLLDDVSKEKEDLFRELEDAQLSLAREKEVLHNSLKQISLMAEEREKHREEIAVLKNMIKDQRAAIVAVFADIIESRPQYHRGHSLNVSEISGAVASMMKLHAEEIDDIKAAALLHELGKVTIPEELSLKIPADYSQSEADLLAQHPLRGAEILEKVSGFSSVSKIIRHIHEHIDGSGFPYGLTQKRIPLGSRIIAVVNLFDNLVFRSSGISPEEALGKIEVDVGNLYDPAVFSALRRYVNRHVFEPNDTSVEMKLFEVQPGMELASGIYTLKGAKLLPEDTVLTEENIRQITRYNKVEQLEDTVFIKG